MNIERILNLLPGRTQRNLEKLVDAYAQLGRFRGAALIARDNKILLRKACGLADEASRRPNTPETRFLIASLTKTFTAVAIMQLAEQGRLSVDDLLSKYLPYFPNANRIHLCHLLSNTSGVFDFLLLEDFPQFMTQPHTIAEMIARFADRPLVFKPGTQFGYSNSNWILLSAVLETITGLPYDNVICRNVLIPAGMNSSGFDWETLPAEAHATGYTDSQNGLTPAPACHSSVLQAAGAMYSTVDDLLHFDAALNNNTLLRRETLRSMWQAETPGYGYGWELHSIHGRSAVAHSGGMYGFISNFVRLVDEAGNSRVTIILLSNDNSAAVPEMTETLAAITLGLPYEMPSSRTFVKVDPVVLAAYTGTFQQTVMGRTFTLEFLIEDDQLVMDMRGWTKVPLKPMSETTFYARAKGEVEMKFVPGPAGRADVIEMVWAGVQTAATRVA
ncbi:MAG TPA: serine hydrolase domain-containing protein [Anaerolineales bacterium]|nr:serine hydrolase domain-containing protein [Anaerolineales bacterium]